MCPRTCALGLSSSLLSENKKKTTKVCEIGDRESFFGALFILWIHGKNSHIRTTCKLGGHDLFYHFCVFILFMIIFLFLFLPFLFSKGRWSINFLNPNSPTPLQEKKKENKKERKKRKKTIATRQQQPNIVNIFSYLVI